MNTRFLEIAKEAGLKFPSEAALSPAEQKFAEMIVKECAAFVSGASEVHTQEDQDACVRSAKGLHNYFGVNI